MPPIHLRRAALLLTCLLIPTCSSIPPATTIHQPTSPSNQPPFANTPYIAIDTGPYPGRYYAKSTPSHSTGTAGTTTLFRVDHPTDQPLHSYNWYAPRQFTPGLLLGRINNDIYLLRLHDEPEPLSNSRIEISFYLNGKHLKSYTTHDLVERGAIPPQNPSHPRNFLNYKTAGFGHGPDNHTFTWLIVVGDNDKRLYFNPLTGDILPTPLTSPPMPPPSASPLPHPTPCTSPSPRQSPLAPPHPPTSATPDPPASSPPPTY